MKLIKRTWIVDQTANENVWNSDMPRGGYQVYFQDEVLFIEFYASNVVFVLTMSEDETLEFSNHLLEMIEKDLKAQFENWLNTRGKYGS